MKNVNFRTLENLNAPEALVEKLLAIPERKEKAPVVIPWWRRYEVIAAASLVLVSIISLTVYFSIGNKINVPIAVRPSSTELAEETDEHGEAVVPGASIAPDGTTYDDENSETVTNADDPSAAITAEPTEKGKPAPTSKPNSAEGGGTKPTTKPDPVVPPEQPTEIPSTESPRETEPADPPEPPVEEPSMPGWEDPTDVPAEAPTEAPSYPRTITVQLSKKFSGLTADSKVYVSVFDSSGNRLGDSDPYASQHIAQISMGAVYVTISYTPADYGILPEDGSYRYEVYNGSGRTFATGTKQLSAT